MSMDNDIAKVLITKEEIENICKRLGEQISRDYEGKNLLVVSVLKGSVIFMADIMRHITCPMQIDFMAVSSYGDSTTSSGIVKFKKDLDTNPEGKDILIIEDILESGNSLKYITEVLKGRLANSIKICAFLDKPVNRTTDIEADYVGARVPDAFVVGYGLDYAEKYRNLPYVGVLKPEIYHHNA